jgi:hypothetical protein
MSFQNALEALDWEYTQYLLRPHPLSQKDGRRAEGIRQELGAFQLRIEETLKRFDTRYWPALLAILRIQPGSLDYMFNAWLEQLRGLGIVRD